MVILIKNKSKENKTKLRFKPIFIVGIILIVFILLLTILRIPEDSWIKGDNGIWVMHGNASSMPDYVEKQWAALDCATNLYTIQKIRGVGSNYECLGNCGDYAVDMVHTPRTSADDLIENQCNSYLNGTLKSFIEINNEGKIVRVVE